MHKRIIPALFGLLLAAGPALAAFEGVLDVKVTVAGTEADHGGNGTMQVAVAKAGTRSDMNMQMGAMNMKMVTLQKSETPNILYRINDASKTYTEIDQSKMMELAAKRQDSKQYSVEKLGEETILDYQTQHVMVKEMSPSQGAGTTMEMWIAKDLMDYATFSKLQDQRSRNMGGAAMLKALKDAGVDGTPLKAITTTGNGAKITMEVVKVDKKSLPASTFEIPAGYTKSEGGMADVLGGVSGPQADDARKKMDEAKKRMEEAMKNMTPEQRAMIEKMMKQRQQGNQ